MRGDRVLEAFLKELNAGRERLARGQSSALDSELEAGRCWEASARARLQLEQAAGRRTARATR